jgi:ABC-type phosphate transport system substrate-binding protein
MSRRRFIAVTGATSVAVGLLLLPAAAPSLAATRQAPASQQPAKHKPAKHTGTSITVHGPHMLNWRTITRTGSARDYAKASTVTVSTTQNLTNQTVHVTWTGFTPTNLQGGQPYYQYQYTLYPVMVVECRGAHPTKVSQCWQAANYQEQFGSNSNAIYTTTSRDGTGSANIEIQNTEQNTKLNCGPTHQCSIAVVPAQGGIAPKCTNHSDDSDQALGINSFGGTSAKCAWAKRVVVPLKFGPVKPCASIRNPDLKMAGSALMSDAMSQWDTGLCRSKDPLAVVWNSSVGEPTAITETVQDNLADVALTTRPATTLTSGGRTYTYAPVGISAAAVAVRFDNPNNGQPYTNVRLDPRLLAKLLTTSYTDFYLQCSPTNTAPCDKAVNKNPSDLFADPEFTALNPKIEQPIGAIANGLADVPIVLGGASDVTYETTRWIADNALAEDFIHGRRDKWGMHVNTHYKGVRYPTETFTARDSSFLLQAAYTPVATLNLVTSALLTGQPPGNNGFQPITIGCPPKQQCFNPLGGEPVGQRALIGITDEADAATFLFPTAALENADGKFVQPSLKSMAAALSSMTKAKNGITEQFDNSSKNPGAYPLTMVVYALVPVSGVSSTKAAQIARWLDYVVGPGQTIGETPGHLPFGYLPLPESMREQARTVAAEVLAQSGGTSSPSPTPTDTSTDGDTDPTPTPTYSTPAPTPTATPATTPVATPTISTVALSRPPTAGMTRYALPILLIVAGFAALLGASIGAFAVGPDVLGRLGRSRKRKAGPAPTEGDK